MIIQGRNIWYRDEFRPAQICIEGKKIISVGEYGKKPCTVDYGDAWVIPGFIDVHTHGAYGYDCLMDDPEGLARWMRKLPGEGVTGFLPTILTSSKENILRSIRQITKASFPGADILGIHLEGPWLDPAYAGAQPLKYIHDPDPEELALYIKTAENKIRIVTFAPEHDPLHRFADVCRQHGIILSVGHSSASYETVAEMHAQYRMSVTHTFNRQTPMHHREPGIAGAALRFPNLYSEIIADGLHVHPAVLNIFFRCKDPGHAVMITDSLLCKGLPAGTVTDFGGQRILLRDDGTAVLAGTDTLAGSTLKMNEGLRILIEKAGVDPVRAIRSCTANPAGLLGMDDHLGMIENGYDADLCILDHSYNVLACYGKGTLLYQKP